MYCPRCGQQQVSDEMKFCSRCGLPTSGLTEWIAARSAPTAQTITTQRSLVSPRQKGIRRGAKVLFLSGVLFFIFLGISMVINDGGPMILPAVVFFVGIILMLYARLFSDPMLSQPTQPSRLDQSATPSALPPASNVDSYNPVNLAGQRVRTNELAQPPSVIENTTKLLEHE